MDKYPTPDVIRGERDRLRDYLTRGIIEPQDIEKMAGVVAGLTWALGEINPPSVSDNLTDVEGNVIRLPWERGL